MYNTFPYVALMVMANVKKQQIKSSVMSVTDSNAYSTIFVHTLGVRTTFKVKQFFYFRVGLFKYCICVTNIPSNPTALTMYIHVVLHRK